MAAAVWRGRITFGMVSIPVRLHKAARRERIRFHHVYRPAELPDTEEEAAPEIEPPPEEPPKGRRLPEVPVRAEAAAPAPEPVARVRNVPVDETTDARLERPQILKGFEIEKDRYVTLEPAEIAALRPRTSTEMTIAEFVRLEEVDPIFFETSYYAVPDRGGEKPYVLLFRALSESGYAAVGSLAMHGREHATLIRPGRHGLIVHTLFFENDVREEEEYRSDATAVDTKEVELARRFVSALAAPFDPGKLKDTYEERLRELIEARKGTTVAAAQEPEGARRAPVVDIMEALRKSLEMVRKPAKREESGTPSRTAASKNRRARSR
jgi:DNA end-binding protein Ku